MLLPLVLSIWVLPSATSEDLRQCYQCANSTQATCKKNLVTCSTTDTACISYYEKGAVGTKYTTLFLMMCGNCSMFSPTSVRFQRGTVKSNSTCCTESSCIPPEPTIEPDRPKNGKIIGNGLICKSCYTTAKSCDCNTFVNCTGQELRCIHRNTIVTGEHTYVLAVRGCTTNQTCQASTQNQKRDKMRPFTMASEHTCSSSNVLLHSPLLWALSAIFRLIFKPIMR